MADDSNEGALLARVDPRWDAARTELVLGGLHQRRARRRIVAVLAAFAVVLSGASFAWQAFSEGESAPSAWKWYALVPR